MLLQGKRAFDSMVLIAGVPTQRCKANLAVPHCLKHSSCLHMQMRHVKLAFVKTDGVVHRN
jgi:hypothetical protein